MNVRFIGAFVLPPLKGRFILALVVAVTGMRGGR
jgi:hypothetical protein